MLVETYPLFQPRKVPASFSGGMQTLVDALIQQLSTLRMSNSTSIKTNKPEDVAREHHVPISSVIWCALDRTNEISRHWTCTLQVKHNSAVSEVQQGYGTLIPDEEIPISGILHERMAIHRLLPADHVFSNHGAVESLSSEEAVRFRSKKY